MQTVMTSVLDDKDQIRELLANYCFYSDGGQADKHISLFTEDCELDLGMLGHIHGRQELLELQRKKGGKPTPIRHLTINIVIEVDGDRATARSYVLVLNTQGETPAIVLIGHYFDSLVKQDGRWLFRHRVLSTEPVDSPG